MMYDLTNRPLNPYYAVGYCSKTQACQGSRQGLFSLSLHRGSSIRFRNQAGDNESQREKKATEKSLGVGRTNEGPIWRGG